MLTSFGENAYVFRGECLRLFPKTQALFTLNTSSFYPKARPPTPKGRHFALSSSGWQEKDRALVRLTPYLVTF